MKIIRNSWNLRWGPEIPSDMEVTCGKLWTAPLRNLLVCVSDCVFGAPLASFLPTGWLCDLLKRFGSSPLQHGHMKGLRRPFCSRSPAQSEEKSLDADPSKKKTPNKQKCLLKSSYLPCAIYLFPMGHHPNGCRLGRSSKALYGMSSSNAGHYPASLIILIVPPYCSFLARSRWTNPGVPGDLRRIHRGAAVVFCGLAPYCLPGLLDCPLSKSEGTGRQGKGLQGHTAVLCAVPTCWEYSLNPPSGGGEGDGGGDS